MSKRKQKIRVLVEERIVVSPTDDTWGIASPTDDFVSHFVKHENQVEVLDKFKQDLMRNPRFHPKPDRIKKIGGKDDAYRWGYDALRCTYVVNDADKTSYPVIAYPAGASTKAKDILK